MEIIATTEDQLDELAAVYLRALADNPDEHWQLTQTKALLADWWHRQPDLFVSARDDEQGALVGGFVVGVRPWWDGNHLVDGELFVDPPFQQRGVAKQLMLAALAKAKKRYAPLLNWDTYTFRNDGYPLSWYRRLGFKEIEEWVMIRADVDAVFAQLRL